MQGKAGTTLLLHNVPGVPAERVLLVGLGSAAQFREKQFRDAVATAVRTLTATGAEAAALYFTDIAVGRRDATWKAAHAVMIARECVYRFAQMKSKSEDGEPALRLLTLIVADNAAARRAALGLRQGLAVAQGVSLAKNLGNLPSNVCTPSYLADQARELGRRHGMKVRVLERAD